MITELLIALYLHQAQPSPFDEINARNAVCSLETVDCASEAPTNPPPQTSGLQDVDKMEDMPIITLKKDIVVLSEQPADKHNRLEKASWYCLEGQTTASGEPMHCDALTFAHKTLPFGTVKYFCYDGRCVPARVNDRGPFVKGRSYDLSLGVFRMLANPDVGVLELEVRDNDFNQ